MGDLSNKIIVIASADGPIGRTAVRILAEQGGIVVFGCNSTTERVSIENSFNRAEIRVLGVICDLNKSDSIRMLLEQANIRYGRIDVIINNAMQITFGGPTRRDPGEREDIVNGNIAGIRHMNAEAVPFLTGPAFQSFINLAIAYPDDPCHLRDPDYLETAAAIERGSLALQAQLAPYNVRVTLIAPRDSCLGELTGLRSGRSELMPVSPEWTARTIAYLISQDEDSDHSAFLQNLDHRTKVLS